MPTTRGNLAQTPINSDTFNLTADLATMADSLEVLVPVASQSAGDTVATSRASAGFAVTDARPLFIYNTTTKTIQVKDTSGWRDMNGPLGLLYTGSVTTASGAVGALSIINNIPSFTFVANRRYRIVWDFSYLVSGTGGIFYCAIHTCSTADSAAATTGLSVIDGRTKNSFVSASTTHSGPIHANFKVTTTSTFQIKFSAQRVAGTTETITILGNGVGEQAMYQIFDDGAVV